MVEAMGVNSLRGNMRFRHCLPARLDIQQKEGPMLEYRRPERDARL